jgi:NTP pyrophosphatase (non-canonical NTP hydrolase)
VDGQWLIEQLHLIIASMLPSFPPSAPTLPQLQQYLDALCRARGWDQASPLEIWLLLTEEMGELAKAIRNRQALYQEGTTPAQPQEAAEEMADVLSYLLQLANQLDIDLEAAFRAKEARNAKRQWR